MGNDNKQQILEIQKYQVRLSKFIGKNIDTNTAAIIWIRKYAKIWRLTHRTIIKQCAQ
ncbi:MAG: hypothetical protein PHC61_17795 [Chitinivibrionales bacterium]|nr:hypothetical protein [Chitinivibrionales bacterium]